MIQLIRVIKLPRQARQKSSTGIYHVMLKGIDDRNIFIEEGDRKKFLFQLLQAQERSGFDLLAYCLMDNHVHLLLEEKEDLGSAMKRITVGYVLWHNNQYGRTGHLFQNRYSSEPVEDDDYLVTVARYIHQNPVKAGIVKKADRYPWSSYSGYLDAYQGRSTPVSTGRIRGYFQSQKQFESFMNEQKEDKCLGYESKGKMTDSELVALMKQDYHVDPVQMVKTDESREVIRSLYQRKRTSIRQLARVFGVSKGVIERAIR
jgi:putative transposase